MATRYCGEVKIDCKLVESSAPGWNHGAYYLCTFYRKYPTKRGWTRMWNEHVGLPAYLTHAIDSPKAYDSAAHAALSFASNESGFGDSNPLLEYLEDGSGFSIRRKPRR